MHGGQLLPSVCSDGGQKASEDELSLCGLQTLLLEEDRLAPSRTHKVGGVFLRVGYLKKKKKKEEARGELRRPSATLLFFREPRWRSLCDAE